MNIKSHTIEYFPWLRGIFIFSKFTLNGNLPILHGLFILRSSSVPNSMELPSSTDFAPTLVRRKSEGTREDERKKIRGISWVYFSFLHITYTKQRDMPLITNCKHFYIFTLQFITKTDLIPDKISLQRFIYLLFAIIPCMFVAFCLTLHPISRHFESKSTVNLTQIKEKTSKSYEKALDYPHDHDGHYRYWRFVRR